MSRRADTPIDAATVQDWLLDGDEIALVDVREHGQYGEGHPFLAVSAPYSRLELELPLLVPRRSTRTVLFDDADGIASLAAARLRDLGYTDLWTLQGGAAAWAASGRTLFQGQNLPSKTFGEQVEHAFDVPRIGPAELRALQDAGENLVLLDGRTPQEHQRMTIPGAIPVPNGELALRWRSVVRDPLTTVVVHCAGRTRSIIGAQILRDLGLPNPVFALENGTQGWTLAGLDLERGSARQVPAVPAADATALARRDALAFAHRERVTQLSPAQAQAWLDDEQRTTYVVDVRTAAEFGAGTVAGARHVPGGQLLQATDQHLGVRHARVLVLDAEDVRAPVAAAWLRRLGVDAATVQGGISAPLNVRVGDAPLPDLPPLQDAHALVALQAAGQPLPLLVDVGPSTAYRQGHAIGALWSIRPRLVADVAAATVDKARPIWLLVDNADIARLAARDLGEAGHRSLGWLPAAALSAAGWPQAATPREPSDARSIDYLFFVHDRHDGNPEASRRYLAWETGLLAQCAPEELAVFRLPAAA